MNWERKVLQEELDEQIVKEHARDIDWVRIIQNKRCSELWLEKYASYLDFDSSTFIRNIYGKVCG